jgi:hypothetical protein
MSNNESLIKIVGKYYYIILLVISLSIFSCLSIYIPDSVNTPLFKEAGELQISGYTGTRTIQARLAYTPINHFGMIANSSYNISTILQEVYNNRSFNYEFGLGYYTKFADYMVFETYGGIGAGSLKYSEHEQSKLFKNKQRKYFITPTIGYVSTFFDAGFSTRFTNISLYNETEDLNGIFIEPSLTFKLGFENLKFIFDFGRSIDISKSNELPYFPYFMNIGGQLSLFKNKKFHLP